LAFTERSGLYQEVEKKRGRPLLVYVTNSRQGAQAQMAADVVPHVAKQLLCLPANTEALDLLVVSDGGDPTVSWRLVSMIREKVKEFAVLLPFSAFSAATLLALGADQLVMHPFANLGPVDPQLRYVKRGAAGQPDEEIVFGSEDVRHFLEFIRSDVGISDQEPLGKAFESAMKDVGAIPLGIAKRGTNLAISMAEKLLTLHMADKNQAKVIAESLNSAYYHHGYPLGRKEAEEIGLSVVKAEDAGVDGLIWEIWTDLAAEMASETPFDPVAEIMKSQTHRDALSRVAVAQIPANLPPQVMQQAYQSVLTQIQVILQDSVDYEILFAAIESARCRSEYRERGLLNAVMTPDLNLKATRIRTGKCWEYYEDRGPQEAT